MPDLAAEIRARGGVASLDGGAGPQQMDPDDVAPFVCYLASDYAANVNAQIFLVHGGEVSLMSQPRPEKTIFQAGSHWDLVDLAPLAKDYLTAGIPNPAPPA